MAFEIAGPYFERKFLVPAPNAYRLNCYLNHYFMVPNTFADGYNTTVYYDTDNLTCYHEGKNGNTRRQKLRWRQYSDKTKGVSYGLECKERNGYFVNKKRIRPPVSQEFDEDFDLNRLFDRFDSHLLGQLLSDFDLDTDKLFPRIVIRYRRRRFICPHSNLRVNLDSEIDSLGVFRDRFTKLSRNERLPFQILELKSESRPSLPKEIHPLMASYSSVSKYASLIEKYPELL